MSNDHDPVPSRKQSSMPLQIPRSPCRQLASSQPDLVAADLDFWMRNRFLTCSFKTATSLSFRNLYIDGERTIIFHDEDVESEDEELKLGEVHPCQKSVTSLPNEGDTDHGEHGNDVKCAEEDLLDIRNQSLTDISLSELKVIPTETREFFNKEISEYLVINDKEGSNDATSDDGHELVNKDDEDAFLVLELPFDDSKQTDSGHLSHSTKYQGLSTAQNSLSFDEREEMDFLLSHSYESLISQSSQWSSGMLTVCCNQNGTT